VSSAPTARSRWPEVALLLSTVLTSGGCVTAGVAVSPIISAPQALTDRTLERTIPADQGLTWAASIETIQRMGFKVDRLRSDEEPRVIEASAEGITVTARVSRMTPSMTRLGLRVESGGITADKDTADAIAGQVLARVQTTGGDTARARETQEAIRAVDGLRDELHQLRSTMGPPRVAPTATPDVVPAPAAVQTVPATPGLKLGAPAVVVPVGYGFEVPPSAVPNGPPAWATGNTDRLDASSVTAAPPAAPPSQVQNIQAVPLAPVGTLSPVPGFTTPSPQR
jgi:hypothetical protein